MGTSLNYAQTASSYDVETSLKEVHTSFSDVTASLYYVQDSLHGSRHEKTCLRWLANHKGADQPAHPRSLISAFVIRLLDSNITRLATSEFQISS